jgi:hypothetical protein
VQKTTLLTARYTPGGGAVKLDMTAIVTSVTGQVYSEDRDGGSVEAGDKARIRATYDLPLHQDDFLSLHFGCSACIKGSAGLSGIHIHNFRVDSDDKLRVQIGAPKHLTGGCGCRGTTP